MRPILFLTEQLIALLVFAVCTAVCVRVLLVSRETATQSRDRQYALTLAESAAECFKSSEGDFERMALLLNGVYDGEGNFVTAHFNEDGDHYCLLATEEKRTETPAAVTYARITMTKPGGDVLVSLAVAGRKAVRP